MNRPNLTSALRHLFDAYVRGLNHCCDRTRRMFDICAARLRALLLLDQVAS